MSIVDIEASINSIPAKKEELRKALEVLQSYSPSFAPFTLQWKDFEDHFLSIEKSIQERLRELKEKDSSSTLEKPAAAAQVIVKVEQFEEVEPRPELKSLCVEMDAKGLLSYLNEHRKNLSAIRRELIYAFRYATDSVKLVFDSLDGFVQSDGISDVEPQDVRRFCMIILECFLRFAPGISQSARERARRFAADLKGMITNGKGDNSVVVQSLLYLIVGFGLVDSFGIDYMLDLIVLVAARKVIVDICRNSVLEENMPVLIEKLINTGRHLDAVKFVVGFNLQEKYPPESLLNAYITESKKAAQEIQKKGNFSVQSKNEAITKEIGALKLVFKIVEEYKLGSLYSLEDLQKSIQRLERQKTEKKAAIPISNSNGKRQQQQHHQQPVKRPRPSTPSGPVSAVHSYTQNLSPHFPPDGVFYQGLAGSYSLSAAPSLYNNNSASFSGYLGRPIEAHAQPIHSSLQNHVYYDRPVTYGGYSLSGFPSTYNFPHYP